MRPSFPATWALVLASFLAVAALQAWPLPLHLTTHLTGDPAGDTGVYVWNLWVFRHELLDQGTSPFITNTILRLGGPADLSLHNYTVAGDLLALPLEPFTGIIGAFNLIYLLNVALAGLGMFLLARHLHRASGIGVAQAWLAGLAFACSPYLVSRSEGHFSLAAAAALPFFTLAFDRAWTNGRARDAAAAGACVAWAGFSDPYYAIYCVLLSAVVILGHEATVVLGASSAGSRTARRTVDALLVILGVTMAALRISDTRAITVGTKVVSTTTLYTPALLISLLTCLRLWLTFQPRLRWSPSWSLGRATKVMSVVGLCAAAILLPQIVLIAGRFAEGRMVHVPVLWRSSAPGLDALSFFVPNPNHPLAPAAFSRWFGIEFQGSLSLVVIGVIAAAALRGALNETTRFWVVVTTAFAVIALGPFVQVGGINTYVPGPWALLRYVPVIGEARMPSRLAVVVTMALSVAFAGALSALGAATRRERDAVPGRPPGRPLHVVVALALAFELLPAPRTLHAGNIPAVYAAIASDPSPGVVLDLPFGIRDGLTSLGYFPPRAQFHQTLHGKPLLGGYLSRVDDETKQVYLRSPFIRTLLNLSEPGTAPEAIPADVLRAGPDFLQQTGVAFVVVDTAHTRPELRAFAIEALHLRRVAESDGYELYRPVD